MITDHGLEALRKSADQPEKASGDSYTTFVKTMNGWLAQKVGRRVSRVLVNPTTVAWRFTQSPNHSTILLEYTIVYSDSTLSTINYAETTVRFVEPT